MEGQQNNGRETRKPHEGQDVDFEQEKAIENITEDAKKEISVLRESGMGKAEELARKFETTVDPETISELSGIEDEAERAKAKLVAELSGIEGGEAVADGGVPSHEEEALSEERRAELAEQAREYSERDKGVFVFGGNEFFSNLNRLGLDADEQSKVISRALEQDPHMLARNLGKIHLDDEQVETLIQTAKEEDGPHSQEVAEALFVGAISSGDEDLRNEMLDIFFEKRPSQAVRLLEKGLIDQAEFTENLDRLLESSPFAASRALPFLDLPPERLNKVAETILEYPYDNVENFILELPSVSEEVKQKAIKLMSAEDKLRHLETISKLVGPEALQDILKENLDEAINGGEVTRIDSIAEATKEIKGLIPDLEKRLQSAKMSLANKWVEIDPARIARQLPELDIPLEDLDRIVDTLIEKQSGDISNVLNLPSISAERKEKVLPLMSALDKLHSWKSVSGLVDEEEQQKILKEAVREGIESGKMEHIATITERSKSVENLDPNFESYLKVAQKIMNSPSRSLRRIAPDLVAQLAEADDPEAKYEEVEQIFIKNNLPTVGKTFKVFEVLHPKDVLEKKLEGHNLSPTLRAESHRGRMLTMYKDLLRANLDSNNPSLRGYLEVMTEGGDVAVKYEEEGFDALDPEEQARFTSFIGKTKTLFEQSQLGRSHEHGRLYGDEMQEVYVALKESLGVKEGQDIKQRVAEMFLRPLGINSIEDALERMDKVRTEADARNREFAKGGRIEIRAGDLLKGFDTRYTSNILTNGSVAKEFLGASSDSDWTPLDTDLSIVLPEDTENSDPLATSLASGYGDMVMLVRDRGQFQKTSSEDDPRDLLRSALDRVPRMELFTTGSHGERHAGIRTGFPSSEIDAFILQKSTQPQMIADLKTRLVARGQYIPIAKHDGAVIFDPDEFDAMREKFFGGLDGLPFKLSEPPFEVSEEHTAKLRDMVEAKRGEREAIREMSSTITSSVMRVLSDRGIKISDGYDDVLTTTEIFDTGSTGRGTNIPGEYDYDYILKLDANVMDQVGMINADITEKLGGKVHEGHRTEQLRVLGAKLPGGEADVDIGFVAKSEVVDYESHQAVKDRLIAIEAQYGEDARFAVQANIALTKKLLKEGEAYKKFEHGGMGGIGVENWILSNGGDMLSAFESFEEAAMEGGEQVSLDEFKKRYQILDPGINAKTGRYDDFVSKLKPEGYQKMVQIIKDYLSIARAQ